MRDEKYYKLSRRIIRTLKMKGLKFTEKGLPPVACIMYDCSIRFLCSEDNHYCKKCDFNGSEMCMETLFSRTLEGLE